MLSALCPDVTVSELRDAFLSGQRAVVRATVCRRLIIRILSKSHLMYYGKADHNRLYPYMVSVKLAMSLEVIREISLVQFSQ